MYLSIFHHCIIFEVYQGALNEWINEFHLIIGNSDHDSKATDAYKRLVSVHIHKPFLGNIIAVFTLLNFVFISLWIRVGMILSTL